MCHFEIIYDQESQDVTNFVFLSNQIQLSFGKYLPYSVAGAAGEVLDPQIGGAGANRNAVVAGADVGVHDSNAG